MSIRKAEIVDLNIVKNITAETIKAIYPKYYPKGAVDFFIKYHNKGNIAIDIEARDVFILEIDKMAIGTVTIKENAINRLFILPKYQKRGYGSVLMNFSEKSILEKFKKIRIDASLPAKQIYLRRGYKQTEYHSILTENGDWLCYDVMEKNIK